METIIEHYGVAILSAFIAIAIINILVTLVLTEQGIFAGVVKEFATQLCGS